MIHADWILTNAIVLTMDDEFNLYEPGAVVVSGDSILAVGRQEEIQNAYQAENLLDCQGKILMPGLINAHTHVPMTLLRGLADDLRLDVWLMGYMMPVEREFVSPEFVRLGTKLACAESIRTGVTTFVDMYYFEHDIAEATAEAGLRAICSQTVLKFPTPDAASYEESLAAAEDFIKIWKDHPLIVPSVAPHAPYTCTDEIFFACTQLAQKYDVPLHTHIAETSNEVENIRKEFGMPVVPYVRKRGIFDAKVIAAHCVHIDEGEMRTIKNAGAGVAHNPSSNLKLASGFANVTRMLELGLNVGIGTDGPASNNDLDMIEEIRLASMIAKCVSGDPTALPARQTLAMATSMGAKAIHLDHLIGSLVVGKRADMILIGIDELHNSPNFKHNPDGIYAQVIYAAKSTDVSDVMVNGRWLMRDRDLLTLDERQLILEARSYAKEIDAFLIKRERSVLSKLIAIGGAMEEESFEVQSKVRINNPDAIIKALEKEAIDVEYTRHYREYDTYFFFEDESEGRLRYREDEFINREGKVTQVRSRLTLVGVSSEDTFEHDVVLSRSRYYAPATHSLRFYREYFAPVREIDIEKNRLRFKIQYKGTDFYINIDTLINPDLGHFLEVKSRTWGREDAIRKSNTIQELIEYLGASSEMAETQDYIEIVQAYFSSR
ncbi:MAG: amidohydrolase family protein [Brevefilum fermentans]|jgi:5-methylthioadenosine/S-adenosylhomocysteine deaminase|uniref:5-methylthioadenosine/S-adenosylhomocysteine deaminase n=1 Tax=Candidatus Brevifilum fermentans TaxID=1986204 RepID=A0A1Y6K3A0_9CHLR|nr:amidohydrolase family protein [Brevefilum fermentans]MDI9566761.1 amidohydrolase family protein [Chloroflexota bacterium]SMX54141.1 5-methylthioadenosine/S-adenosylhomocysteine deaminase [Brevefilum fermentans]HPX96143.1 amidohydrolase family protein [Brevefilum fermentans]